MTDKVIARAAGSGAASWALGGLFETLVAGVETGGLLGVSLVTQPAGTAPPMHVHSREAEAWYLKALKLQPTHKGANEYLGELYLELKQPDKAKERLSVLKSACGNCAEYKELASKINQYTASN